MGVEKFKLSGKKGIELSCYKVVPEEEVKAVIQIFHGMGEHKGRYLHFAKYLAKKSFAVYAHDHRKHGESVNGDQGVGIFTKDDKWEDMIVECNFVNHKIKKDYPNVPIIILGHSMGSIMARKFIATYPKGANMAIISGTLPYLKSSNLFKIDMLSKIISLFNPKNKRSKFLGKKINAPLNKPFIPNRTKFDWITSDDKLLDKYIEDPLCGFDYSSRFYSEWFYGIANANLTETISKTQDIPILIISGENDPLSEKGYTIKQIRELYSGHGYLQLTNKLVAHARHEVLNEKDKLATYKYIISWIESYL